MTATLGSCLGVGAEVNVRHFGVAKGPRTDMVPDVQNKLGSWNTSYLLCPHSRMGRPQGTAHAKQVHSTFSSTIL